MFDTQKSHYISNFRPWETYIHNCTSITRTCIIHFSMIEIWKWKRTMKVGKKMFFFPPSMSGPFLLFPAMYIPNKKNASSRKTLVCVWNLWAVTKSLLNYCMDSLRLISLCKWAEHIIQIFIEVHCWKTKIQIFIFLKYNLVIYPQTVSLRDLKSKTCL